MHHKGGSQHVRLLAAAMLLALLLSCGATAHCDHHSHHRHLLQPQEDLLPEQRQHQQHQQHQDLSRKLQQQQQQSSSLAASTSDGGSVGVSSSSGSGSSSSEIRGPIPAIRRRCGTQSPSAELLASVFARLAEERRKKSDGTAAGAADGSIVVPVAFTVVEPEQQDAAGLTNRYYGTTTASQLTALLAALNAAFSGQLQPRAADSGEAAAAAGVDTPFRFRLCSLQTVRNSSWYTSPPLNSTHLNIDGEARQEQRSGGRGTLNVFIKPLNVFPGMDSTDGWTYGQATLPHYLQFPPFPAYSAGADGVVIDGSIIPGATDAAGDRFPDGRASSLTLAHQVAHWLSGLHTYQSTDVTPAGPSTCSAATPPPPWAPEAAGDFCADTPVHAAPATAADTSCSGGADGGRDSCSNWPGRDPVFNILNQVDEGCMLGFTACQRNVFEDAWTAWRAAAAAAEGSSATTASATDTGPPTTTDDSFRIQVAPAGGGTHSTVAPASFVLDIFKNDVSISGHALTVDDLSWAIVSPPARGRLSVTEDATALVYTPDQAGSLTDSFRYRAFDCSGASAPATVTISVVEEGCPVDAASFPPCVDPRTGLMLAENATCAQNTTSIFCIPSFSGTRWCRYRYRPAFVECRPTAAECDAPERCTGVGPNCPADVFDSSCMATTCANAALPECVDGAAGSLVRGDEPCTTNSTIYCSSVDKDDRTLSCSYPYKPATAVCRPSRDDCDMVDRCVPGQPTCPEDKKVPNCPLPACPTSGLPECVQPTPVVLVQSCVSGINQHCLPVPNTDPQLFCRYGGYKSSLCRPAKDACDLAESCAAGSAVCPPDVLKPNCETGFKCPTAGLGNCVNSTSGLVVDSCTNSPTTLCKIIASSSRFTCRYAYLSSSTVCRAAKDECDLPEFCQPGDAICPSDLSKPGCVLPANNTGLCPTEGLPDCVNATSGKFASICFTTSSAFCLSVASSSAAGNFTCKYDYKPATTACRPPVNQCDLPEFCNFAPNCPPDIVRSNCVSPGTSCPTTGLPPCVDPSNGVIVSAPSSCLTTKKVFCQNVTGLPGTTGTQFCRYSYRSNSSVCRPAAGPCDKPDTCHENGAISASCGPDRLLSSATVCRPAASACDAPEVCSGTSIECPPDAVVPPKKVICRQAYDPCDLPEVCSGQGRTCPADRVRLNGRACSLEPYGVFLRTALLQQAKLVNATQGPAAFVLANGTAISPPPVGLHRCGKCRRGVCDQTPEQQWWCW